jgi:hypothetical protein
MIGFFSAACAVAPTRQYCDGEVSYEIWKQDSGFRLDLHIGKAPTQTCSVNPDRTRTSNLYADVASVDEGVKLVDEYHQKYLERLARVSVQAQK